MEGGRGGGRERAREGEREREGGRGGEGEAESGPFPNKAPRGEGWYPVETPDVGGALHPCFRWCLHQTADFSGFFVFTYDPP